jgi:hypothetical protein
MSSGNDLKPSLLRNLRHKDNGKSLTFRKTDVRE